MNRAQRRELGRYVLGCMELLELRDWTVDLALGRPDGGDAAAEALGLQGGWQAALESTPGCKHARLSIDPDCVEWPPEELRQCVAHELMHCHFAALWHQVRLDLLAQLGQGAYDLFIASAERNLEYGVDAVGDAVAPRLPLIRWP